MRTGMKQLLLLMVLLTLCFGGTAYAQISAGGVPRSFELALNSTAPSLTMPRVDVESYLAEDALAGKDEPYRFGASIDVHVDLANSGGWTEVAGGRVWRLRLASRGAYSLSLLYDHWYLPEGAELFIYNDDRSQVIGAFTSLNNWQDGTNITQPVAGDAVTLEYFEPGAVSGEGSLSISNVVHAYRNLFGRPAANPLDNYGDSGTCNNNVNCPEGAGWQADKRGVCMILTSGGSRLCTGSLINNVRGDLTPYFLTANHCLGGSSTWQFMFNYESPGCPNQDGPTNQTMSNSTLRANNAASDFALLQLSSAVPLTYNPYFNGWNNVDAASTNSVCIHHPSGDIKKITFDNNAPQSSSWSGTPANSHWRILVWDDGTTEPGSSGSPLFDQNHRITGQLHGGTASCSNNIDDYFGKFSMSWNYGTTAPTRLIDWLDPDATGATVLDGLDPNGLGRIAGVVRDAGTGNPVGGVAIEVLQNSQQGATDGSGVYSIPLAAGTFDLAFSKFGYVADTAFGLVVIDGDTTVQNMLLTAIPIDTLWNESFESGAPEWTHEGAGGSWVDQWHISTERFQTGTHAYKCGDTGTGNYANLNDARLNSPVFLNLPADARLEFSLQIESEVSGTYADSAYDGLVVELSVNGGAFAAITPTPGYVRTFRYSAGGGNPATGPMPGRQCYAGTLTPWSTYALDLAAYAAQNVQVRFRFGSDAGTVREGAYIDDVLLFAPGNSAAPTVVTEVTLNRVGDNLVLDWLSDGNLHYRIYSGPDPDNVFTTFEGAVDTVGFVVPGGLSATGKCFVVTGWDGVP